MLISPFGDVEPGATFAAALVFRVFQCPAIEFGPTPGTDAL